ncbi:LAMI_0E13520g1_1 [Lachancea mirantina]|uniref:LAMI_0E13520g1_1 n=1 Tax=Lachancea mirantina TaxID=1230905 RepID=A0A1G4JQV7_9SACH|nr:LAMI_0E13520g1_1 [Lachancea mirantina]
MRLKIVRLIVFLMIKKLVLGLHFYMKPGEVRCFYEDLAEGAILIGDFDAQVERNGRFEEDFGLKMTVTVDETFDNDHRVLNMKNSHTGDFMFTALESGEHRVCVKPTFSNMNANLRIFLELEFANVQSLDSRRMGQMESLRSRVLQLLDRVDRIRKEQKEIMKREAKFRDQSESTNSRIMVWSCIQLIVLFGTCVFQMRYLKNFFIKEKVI